MSDEKNDMYTKLTRKVDKKLIARIAQCVDGNSRIIGIQQCAQGTSDIRATMVTTKTEQGIKLNFSLISCRKTRFCSHILKLTVQRHL